MESIKSIIGLNQPTAQPELDSNDKLWSQLDLLEKGLTCQFNPALFMQPILSQNYRIQKEIEDRGLYQCHVTKDKKTHTFYLHQGKDTNDPHRRFLLMGRFYPQQNEFRIYTSDQSKTPQVFQEDSHTAKMIFNRHKKQFVIKSRYCLTCSKTSPYYCDSKKHWPFQQELGYFYIREEDIEPKTHIKYTWAYLCFPMIKPKTHEITPWCPRAVQLKEDRTYSAYDGPFDAVHAALNDPEFNSSLKCKFYEEVSIDKTMKDDRLLMRSRKPHFKRIERSLSLNFGGRVKKASRKNIQIEYKFKSDNKVKVVLQHGKQSDDCYTLDFGFPFTAIQAFAFSLGLFYFRKEPHSVIK